MYESMILGAKNFLRIILKFPKIGLKKLLKNSKNEKIGENFDRWCDRRDLNLFYAFKFLLILFVYNYTRKFKNE